MGGLRRAFFGLRRRAAGCGPLAAAALAAALGLGPGCAPALEAASEASEPSALYLRAVDGAQCGLDADAREEALAGARARIEGKGARAEAAWVAPSLSGLPEACRPAGGRAGLEELFGRYPAAVIDAESYGRMTCQACGCPQPWLVCARAAGAPEALRRAGFAPVRAVAD